jgi:PAS domain S-box-containing protein
MATRRAAPATDAAGTPNRVLTSRRLQWLGAIAAATMVAGAVVTAWLMYVRTLEEQSAQLRNVALLIAEQSARALDQVDLLLRNGAEEVQRARAAGLPLDAREIAEVLRDLASTTPQAAGMVLFDPGNRIVLSTLAQKGPPVELANRQFVSAHAGAPANRMLIGAPVTDVAAQGVALPLSRRIDDPRGGGIAGVLVCAVVGGYFEGLFGAIELGRSTRILMTREDGVLLAGRGTRDLAPGVRVPRAAAWRTALEGARGASVVDEVADAPVRLTGLAAVPGMAASVAVSLDRDEALAPWRTRAGLIVAGSLLAAMVVMFASQRLASEIRAGESLQARVAEGEARVEAIVQSAMDAIITCDDTQNIVLFNGAAEKVFGVAAAEILGQPLSRLIPERYRSVHGAHVNRFGEHGQTTRRMGGLTVLHGLRANGEEFPIDASISQVTLGGRRYYTVILRDVTARLEAEQEIARGVRERGELARAAQEALEEERRRVARELHDELGQGLTAIKMDLLEARALVPPEDAELLRRCDVIRGLVDDTVAATRRIASDLRPLMLDDLGLGAAVDWLLQGFAKRTGVTVSVQVEDAVAEIGEPAASAVFRIIQESVTNIARHAEASHVDVRVRQDGGFVTLRVQDDGRGIAPEDQAKRGSFGLRGMRERARLLGGSASVERAPDGGTVVTARIPLETTAVAGDAPAATEGQDA